MQRQSVTVESIEEMDVAFHEKQATFVVGANFFYGAIVSIYTG